jgi:formylglycine-generating enzyme required for sulfatase activity
MLMQHPKNWLSSLALITALVPAFLVVLCSPVSQSFARDEVSSTPLTYLIPSINYKMVYIPPGTFMMGSPLSERGRYDDESQHQVTLTKGFYIGVTEVTQGQWKRIMGNNPSHFKKCGDACPVEQVSWNDCQEFILRLNTQEKTRRYRLFSEAEWEYACRATSQSAFANGDITEKDCGYDPNLDKIGWYCGNSGEKTHPVTQKNPNAWGLHDMHGNVWEWCHDWHGEYPSIRVTDPKGPLSGLRRIYRGGGWNLSARRCRSAFRDSYSPNVRYKLLGFRLVREAAR